MIQIITGLILLFFGSLNFWNGVDKVWPKNNTNNIIFEKTKLKNDVIAEYAHDGVITFHAKEEEILKFDSNGDMFWRGRLVTNDKDLVDAFRDMVRNAKYEHIEDEKK